jgi:hypothetical protein
MLPPTASVSERKDECDSQTASFNSGHMDVDSASSEYGESQEKLVGDSCCDFSSKDDTSIVMSGQSASKESWNHRCRKSYTTGNLTYSRK